jgi:hypothetical protein
MNYPVFKGPATLYIVRMMPDGIAFVLTRRSETWGFCAYDARQGRKSTGHPCRGAGWSREEPSTMERRSVVGAGERPSSVAGGSDKSDGAAITIQ